MDPTNTSIKIESTEDTKPEAVATMQVVSFGQKTSTLLATLTLTIEELAELGYFNSKQRNFLERYSFKCDDALEIASGFGTIIIKHLDNTAVVVTPSVARSASSDVNGTVKVESPGCSLSSIAEVPSYFSHNVAAPEGTSTVAEEGNILSGFQERCSEYGIRIKPRYKSLESVLVQKELPVTEDIPGMPDDSEFMLRGLPASMLAAACDQPVQFDDTILNENEAIVIDCSQGCTSDVAEDQCVISTQVNISQDVQNSGQEASTDVDDTGSSKIDVIKSGLKLEDEVTFEEISHFVADPSQPDNPVKATLEEGTLTQANNIVTVDTTPSILNIYVEDEPASTQLVSDENKNAENLDIIVLAESKRPTERSSEPNSDSAAGESPEGIITKEIVVVSDSADPIKSDTAPVDCTSLRLAIEYVPVDAGMGEEGEATPEPKKLTKYFGKVIFHEDGDVIGADAPALGPENKGCGMLTRMGWKEGTGLGSARAGILKPIPLTIKNTKSGLGLNMFTPGVPTILPIVTGGDLSPCFRSQGLEDYANDSLPGPNPAWDTYTDSGEARIEQHMEAPAKKIGTRPAKNFALVMRYVREGPQTGCRTINLNVRIRKGRKTEFRQTCHYNGVVVMALDFQPGSPDAGNMMGFLPIEKGDHLQIKESRGVSHYLVKQEFGARLEGLVKINFVEMRADIAETSSSQAEDELKSAGMSEKPVNTTAAALSRSHHQSERKGKVENIRAGKGRGNSKSKDGIESNTARMGNPEGKVESKLCQSPTSSSRATDVNPPQVTNPGPSSSQSVNSRDSISKETPVVIRKRYVDIWRPDME